jgi:hypothetical protein
VKLAETDPTIEVSTSPGIVRVAVHPARSWPLFLFICVILALSIGIDEHWARIWSALGVFLILAFVWNVVRFLFRFLGTETVEINATKISLRKDILGWYRIREFHVEECRELEWKNGSEDEDQSMQFKVGRKMITFAHGLTEDQSLSIFGALQDTLPSVAQQLCSYPEKESHFITLGLS